MAERFNRIGADKYTIEVNDNGEIVLDTGNSVGKVTVKGDLDVLGVTTTVESTEVAIGDKTFTINKNETVGGIKDLLDGYNRAAGIIISRGPGELVDARMFYDEDLNGFDSGGVDPGAFYFGLGNGEYKGIHTSSIITDTNEDLYLIGQGTGTVTVIGVTNYERQVFLYDNPTDLLDLEINFGAGPVQAGKNDALISAKSLVEYVDSYHTNFFQPKIEKDDSSVEIFDADIDGGDTKVVITLDGVNYTNFYDTRVEIGNLRFISDPGDVGVITSNGIDSSIRLRGSGTGQVEIDGYQNFLLESDPADPPSEGITLYSKALGDGGTGLYFTNQDGTQDEFVSRNKALLYSIIF